MRVSTCQKCGKNTDHTTSRANWLNNRKRSRGKLLWPLGGTDSNKRAATSVRSLVSVANVQSGRLLAEAADDFGLTRNGLQISEDHLEVGVFLEDSAIVQRSLQVHHHPVGPLRPRRPTFPRSDHLQAQRGAIVGGAIK